MKPFQQGDLDGLCGLYSIINATKMITTRLPHEYGEELLLESVLALEEKGKTSSKFITDGITITDIAYVLKNVICDEFEIVRSKPFHRKTKVDIDHLWQVMFDFMAHYERRSIILGLEWEGYGHWTVIREIGHKRMWLHDSYKRVFLNRSQCSTIEVTAKTPVFIQPSTIYFLRSHD